MSEKLSEQLYTLADALKTTNRARGIAIARIARKVAALEQQLVVAQMEEDVLGQRVAVLSADLAAKDAEIAKLRERMERDADSWDEKNEGVGSPKGCSVDYIYGYNAGCAETFRACAYRTSTIGVALAETPAAPLTALALPEDDVPDAAPEVK